MLTAVFLFAVVMGGLGLLAVGYELSLRGRTTVGLLVVFGGFFLLALSYGSAVEWGYI